MEQRVYLSYMEDLVGFPSDLNVVLLYNIVLIGSWHRTERVFGFNLQLTSQNLMKIFICFNMSKASVCLNTTLYHFSL